MADSNKSPLQEMLEGYRKAYPGKALSSLEQLVFSVLSDGQDEGAALSVMNNLRKEFVDWNECRVARMSDISRQIEELVNPDDVAFRLRDMLNRLFDLRGALDLSFLSEMKSSEARKGLSKIDTDIPRDVYSLILFQLCPGTTIPISDEGIAQAKKEKLLGRTGNKQQLQKKLLAELTQEEAAEIVQYLEYIAAGGGKKNTPAKSAGKPGKPAAKEAAKKKTVKKK